jgi:hypothetical protein
MDFRALGQSFGSLLGGEIALSFTKQLKSIVFVTISVESASEYG